jgi:hypothetical protein
MKFLMLVCRDESIEFAHEDQQNIGPQVQAWVSEMEERGVRLQGDVLAPVNADDHRFSATRRDTRRAWSARGNTCARIWLQSS